MEPLVRKYRKVFATPERMVQWLNEDADLREVVAKGGDSTSRPWWIVLEWVGA